MTEQMSAATIDDGIATYRHFIDGAYVDPIEGEWIDSTDPYRNEVWARVPLVSA